MAHYSKTPNISGQTFGLWSVLERSGSMPYGGAAFLCRCACGTEKRVSAASLRKGNTTNCGCQPKDKFAEQGRKHGLYKHPLYRAWGRMKERCYYKKHRYYDRYGGRGITVCERWQSFKPFYDDNIAKWRRGLTLDRIDNDGDYSPDNCRWVTRTVQSRNRSNTVTMTLNGETLPLVVWAERTGISANALRLRRTNGWSDEDALTIP